MNRERESLRASAEISEASLEDAEKIADIRKKTWLSTYAVKGNITAEEILALDFKADTIAKEIREKKEDRYWVSKVGKDIVGFGHAIKALGKHEIKSLYILEEYQKIGAGGMLIEEMFNYLGSEKPIYVDVLGINDAGLRFYEKYGFKEFGRRISDRFLRGANKSVVVIQMKKEFKNS